MISNIRDLLPSDVLIRLLGCLALQLTTYYVPKHIKRRTRSIMVTRFDHAISQRPWWVFIYVLSFAQWYICYWAVFRFGRANALQGADTLSKIACMLFYILLPTTMEREEPRGFLAWGLRIIYRLDAPTNLFPSMHCTLSMICLIMLFTADVPLCLQLINAVFSLLVFTSTLKTKQHVIVDVLSGVLLGALSCGLFLLIL